METLKFTEGFLRSIETSDLLRAYLNSAYIIMMAEAPLDWGRLRKSVPDANFIIATTKQELVMGAETAGFKTVFLPEVEDETQVDRIYRALHSSTTKNFARPGATVVVLYSSFDPAIVDTFSLVRMEDRQDKLDWRVLRRLDTAVPHKTVRQVLKLAIAIGRDGREGKPIGTMFVIGDTKKVMELSRPIGFDPVRGYTCKDRTLFSSDVIEGIKEVAQLDGAFIISHDCVVRAACRMISAPADNVTLQKGLGTRHGAGAAITQITGALAIVVSQSDGVVRLFNKGKCEYRIDSRKHSSMILREDEKEYPMFGDSSN